MNRNQIPSNPRDAFWGITTFYNPQGYRNKYDLYRRFRESSKRQGLCLIAVELSFGNKPFELKEDDAEIVLRIRGIDENIMWQKERLLNFAFEHLPKECHKFAWIDCDIIFKNENWVKETIDLLDQYPVVQPFSISFRLPRNVQDIQQARISELPYERRVSMAFSWAHLRMEQMLIEQGHTGFAWAARRSVFEGVGFYDKMIVGGGDTVLSCGFKGEEINKFTSILPEKVVQSQTSWIRSIFPRVEGRVYYVPGVLIHLWHGESRRRKTSERLKLLSKYDFDPNKDIIKGSNHCWQWVGGKGPFYKAVRKYFWSRNEEGNRFIEFIYSCRDLKDKFIGFVNVYSVIERTQKRLLKQNKLSVVILNWKRPDLLKKIIKTYMQYSFIDDFVIWNNNSKEPILLDNFPKVKVINCKYDAGLDSRYAATMMANQEHVLIHDDDLILSQLSLALLFKEYLRLPDVIHGLIGRNINKGYNLRNVVGKVDIVLTRCQILNKRYIRPYFQNVALFDYIRTLTCGNGEDIIMNYVVRGITGRKNVVHRFPFHDYDTSREVSKESIRLRPFHQEQRQEIAKFCTSHFTNEKHSFNPNQELINQIVEKPTDIIWPKYFKSPQIYRSKENFSLSSNVCSKRLNEALDLLCRQGV
ncbi:MAG: hypothetical protein WCH62_02525 [Candidatus Omnitrophota bacterium]